MFEVSIALLQQYIELRQRHDPQFPVGVLSEARFRLDQLDYVLMRVRELETGPLQLNIRFDSSTLLTIVRGVLLLLCGAPLCVV